MNSRQLDKEIFPLTVIMSILNTFFNILDIHILLLLLSELFSLFLKHFLQVMS